MATYRKRANSWIAEVYMQGVRKSKSFPTKAQAVAWATQFEAGLLKEKRGEIPDKTFGDLMERYHEDVSTTKKGERWERIRIDLFKKMPFAKVKLENISEVDFVKYRDARLKEVSAATVSREMSLLSHMCTIAIKEWKWLKESPLSNVRRPRTPHSRDRRISEDEMERILFASGYEEGKECKTTTSRVGAAFLFAIETAMRAGEIVGLTWDRVDKNKRIAKLAETKNGRSREVPLSKKAMKILEQMPKENNSVFNLTSGNLDALFRKIKSRCLIEDLHFHDTRHEAITRLAKKLDVLPLARMVGHRDLKMLMVYYNEKAEELVHRLD